MEKRKYGWGIYYTRDGKKASFHMMLMEDNKPLCKRDDLMFNHFLRRVSEPEVRCEACYRMRIMRELSE